jgi:hypothetical protein
MVLSVRTLRSAQPWCNQTGRRPQPSIKPAGPRQFRNDSHAGFNRDPRPVAPTIGETKGRGLARNSTRARQKNYKKVTIARRPGYGWMLRSSENFTLDIAKHGGRRVNRRLTSVLAACRGSTRRWQWVRLGLFGFFAVLHQGPLIVRFSGRSAPCIPMVGKIAANGQSISA